MWKGARHKAQGKRQNSGVRIQNPEEKSIEHRVGGWRSGPAGLEVGGKNK
jgi:hypothetical protein